MKLLDYVLRTWSMSSTSFWSSIPHVDELIYNRVKLSIVGKSIKHRPWWRFCAKDLNKFQQAFLIGLLRGLKINFVTNICLKLGFAKKNILFGVVLTNTNSDNPPSTTSNKNSFTRCLYKEYNEQNSTIFSKWHKRFEEKMYYEHVFGAWLWNYFFFHVRGGCVQLRKLKQLNIVPPPTITFWLEVAIWKIQTKTYKNTTRVSTFKITYPTWIVDTTLTQRV